MSWKRHLKEKGLIVFSLLILSAILLEIFLRDQLFTASLDIIITLQKNLPTFTKYIFRILAGLGNPDIIMIVYLLILAITVNKFFLVKLGIYISFIGYFLSIIKTIYANPRPYWIRPYQAGLPNYISPGIQPFEKYAEFGNPSGHAFFVAALYGYLAYLFIIYHRKKLAMISQGHNAPLIENEASSNILEKKNVNIPAEESAGFTRKNLL